MSSRYRVYEVVCRDKRIPDRYIGYTCMTKNVFIDCQKGIVRDKVTGKKRDLGDDKQPPSRLQAFVSDHGGWDNWNFRVFPHLWNTGMEANVIKGIIMDKFPDKYTLNIYKTGTMRAPIDYDSCEESVDLEVW